MRVRIPAEALVVTQRIATGLERVWKPAMLSLEVREDDGNSLADVEVAFRPPGEVDELTTVRGQALRIARRLEGIAADLRVICGEGITPEEARRILAGIEERIGVTSGE